MAHVKNNSGKVEWYTPPEIIERVRRVLKVIALDPASCAEANKVVKAYQYFSTDENGLTSEWKRYRTIFMNPPYRHVLITAFIARLIQWFNRRDHYVAMGTTTREAIVLTNNATETKWAQSLMGCASAICFPHGRIRFWRPDKPAFTPLQGQMICYLGERPDAFRHEFSGLGRVW